MSETFSRIGDMHPNRTLRIEFQRSGDVVLSIEQDHATIADSERRHDCKAIVEFCVNGGRSPHTREALRNLALAVEKDNKEKPIPYQES